VASPIYFGSVTAQTKVWLDRLFPFIDVKANSFLPQGKKAAFVFTQNQPDPELFLESINSFTSMLNYIGFEIKDRLISYDVDRGHNKPMVTENKEFMKKAYDLGKNLLD
jgi:multimeric flavodoxin WrbA